MNFQVKKSLLCGVPILGIVVLLWVGSAALSRYLYTQVDYDKPLFATYFKTSLLSIYLIGFIFWRPWQRLCCFCGVWKFRRRPALGGEGISHLYARRAGRIGPYGSVSAKPGAVEEGRKLLCGGDGEQWSVQRTGKVVCVEGVDGKLEVEGKPKELRDRSQNDMVGKIVCIVERRVGENCEGGGGVCVVQRMCGNSEDGDVVGEGVSVVERRGDEQARIQFVQGSDEHVHIVSCLKSTGGKCLKFRLLPPTSSTSPPCSRPTVGIECVNDPDITSSGDGVKPSEAADGEGATKCPFLRYYKINTCTLDVNKLIGTKTSSCLWQVVYSRAHRVKDNTWKQVASQGPPETKPLGCYDRDESEREKSGEAPLLPCKYKYCKVRFNPRVEVREMIGSVGDNLTSLRKFDQSKDIERYVQKLPVALLPVNRVILLSLVFGIIWFFANYLYSVALERTSVAVVNTVSAMSSIFVMLLAGLPCLSVTDTDKFTIPRCLVTLFSVVGTVMVVLSASGIEKGYGGHGVKLNEGAFLALGGAILYAIYLVLLRRVVKDSDSLEIPMFFGFVGVLDCILLLPLLVIWHFAGIETFEMPPTPNVWTLLIVNGFAGTVISELLWLWGVFLTSPLLGTLALSLVTPMSIAYSIAIGDAGFSWLFVAGAILILVSFVGVVILEQLGAWDPIWKYLRQIFSHPRTDTYEGSDAIASPTESGRPFSIYSPSPSPPTLSSDLLQSPP